MLILLNIEKAVQLFSCAPVRSTLRQSRPNEAGLKCPSVPAYVRMYVRPSVHKKFLPFGMYVEVDE